MYAIIEDIKVWADSLIKQNIYTGVGDILASLLGFLIDDIL